MSRKSILLGVVTLVAVALTGYTLFAQNLKVMKRGCCIAGTYAGYHEDIASSTCTSPEKGKFKMVIKQAKGCGGQIWGTITSPDGNVQKFKGTVEAASKGCCRIKGVIVEERRIISRFVMRKPVRPVVQRTLFEGLICKVKGKWVVEKGKYKSANGCSGIFKLNQI
jgi:hypothetical protein